LKTGNEPINISDLIGIIVAFLAFVFMSMRPFFAKKKPLEEEVEEEYEEEFIPPPQKKAPTAPKKWEKDRFNFKTSIENRHKPSAVEQRKLESSIPDRALKELEDSFEEDITQDEAYAIKEKARPSYAEELLKKNSLRKSILVAEILNKPRGLRKYDGRL